MNEKKVNCAHCSRPLTFPVILNGKSFCDRNCGGAYKSNLSPHGDTETATSETTGMKNEETKRIYFFC